MKKIVRAGGLVVAVSLLLYIAFAMHSAVRVGQARLHLLIAIEGYKKQRHAWPRSYADLRPYLDAPYGIESLDPRFTPINENRAYVYFSEWRGPFPVRRRHVVSIDGRGIATFDSA